MSTITFLTSSAWVFSASAGSGSVTIEAWGAGGHGRSTGGGGSGGAYSVTSSIILNTGSFQIVIGAPTTTDGGETYVTASGLLRVRAAGGKQDGTTSHQAAINTGSTSYIGGAGGVDSTGYSSYNGAGGGGSGAAGGTGYAGSNDPIVDDTLLSSFYYRNSPACPGGDAESGGGEGAAGAYYQSGVGPLGVIAAESGSVPGGGGGGSYDYGTDTSGHGGGGKVVITY